MNDEGEVIRLLTRPHLQTSPTGTPNIHIDKFEAWFDGELIVVSKQPRLDGARELLRRGHSPDTLMTTRAHDRGYDSFIPAPISEVAKWTVSERDKRGLCREQWRSYQDGISRAGVAASIRKSPLRGVKVPETEDDAVRADSRTATRQSVA